MEEDLYYVAPSDEIFEEVRCCAIAVWLNYKNNNPYDDYAESKIEQISDIGNVRDNVMYMVAMFDINNQRRLAELLSDEAKQVIAERMLAGGQHFHPFGLTTMNQVKDSLTDYLNSKE